MRMVMKNWVEGKNDRKLEGGSSQQEASSSLELKVSAIND